MASNLVLLSYKPGIQQDGTDFQGDMCSNGQWIRFQRGKVKKIGGMKAPAVLNGFDHLVASDISLFPTNNANQIFGYIAASSGVYTVQVDQQFNNTANQTTIIPNAPANILWQSTTIINNNQRQIVFFGASNALNIADNSAPVIYYGNIFDVGTSTLLNNTAVGINALINGGMVYSAPYLFLYGSNGLVQYSASNNPLNFVIPVLTVPALGPNPTAAALAAYTSALAAYNTAKTVSPGSINISNDKVIYGRPIRGGPNSPVILFWTLSSVVRLINVGDQTGISFQKDVVSTSTSILSSKCVVEYDGLFFWPGTDRFFTYNGVVGEMVNITNLNYFYDNIDMDYRQKVFGVKNTKYGEIWWFYPEKIGAPNRLVNAPLGANTRALIYNVRENSWYDTQISRDAGFFSNDLGIMATYGASLANYVSGNNWLWRHEFGFSESVENVADALIPSSVTTPTFGWSSFNPASPSNTQKAQPIDRWIEIRRIEPDFVATPLANAATNMSVAVNTKIYAQSPSVRTNTYSFNAGSNGTDKIDTRDQGRQMTLTFSSNHYFEMGNIMMLLGIGDGQ